MKKFVKEYSFYQFDLIGIYGKGESKQELYVNSYETFKKAKKHIKRMNKVGLANDYKLKYRPRLIGKDYVYEKDNK